MTTPLLIATIAALAAAGAWASLRWAWWRPAAPWSRPRVLMYHMIRPHTPGARFNKLRVPPEQFERQISWLSERGFTFVFASRLYDEEPLPGRTVCLTFDDGYADNLLEADPILQRHNARATLYLVEQRDGGWSSKKKSHHADDELANEPKLTDEQIRALLATGRWELGGHSRTHAHLPSLPDEAAREEIASARASFPERFGARAPTFAYPFGRFEASHVRMVEQAGYRGAMTTDPGIPSHPVADPYRTPRVKVSGKDGVMAFRLRLRGGKRGLRK